MTAAHALTIAVPIPPPEHWRVLSPGERMPPGYMVALELVSRQASRRAQLLEGAREVLQERRAITAEVAS